MQALPLVLLVAEDSEIASADDLEGKLVGAQTGTTGELTATEMVGDSNVELVYNSYFEAVQSLLTGKIDAIIIDGAPAKVFLSQNEGKIKQVGDALSNEEYAVVAALDNTELIEKINGAIGELQESGEIDTIMNKYIPAE